MSPPASSERRTQARGTERLLIELLELERELLELSYVRRADALERAREAVRRVGDLAAAESLLARAASELGTSSEFRRVLLSEVDGGRLAPVALWSREDPGDETLLGRLRETPVRLQYPLMEYEVTRDRCARVVDVARAGPRAPRSLSQTLGWSVYAVAALTAGGDTIGLLHAERGTGPEVPDAVDLEVLATYAEGLSQAFERAVLRHTLTLHRAELASAVQWMGARVQRLSDLAGGASVSGPHSDGAFSVQARRLSSLTPRELEVLHLLARGMTNVAIANALVVREGTVKYHVKNILRKLGATSRADAVARYVRAAAEPEAA